MKEIVYSKSNNNLKKSITAGLNGFLKGDIPVIVCIGTDAIIGDSLGPIAGSIIKKRLPDAVLYGSLDKTITAKEIKTINLFLSKVHRKSKVLVIDAAVGEKEDVGKIKIGENPIKPGLGAKKDLPALGDVSIIYVAGERSGNNLAFGSLVRLSDVCGVAEVIEDSIIEYIEQQSEAETKISVSF